MMSSGNFCLGSESFQPEYADPLLETWRWRTFPHLSGLYVQCMAEGADSTIWFGTGNGLWNYDGVEWVSYTANEKLGHIVTFIHSHADGRISVCGDWGISQLSNNNWSWLLANPEKRFGDFRNVFTGPDGRLWAATSLGILRRLESGWMLYTDAKNAERVRQDPQYSLLTKIEILPKTTGAHFSSGGSVPFIGRGITSAIADARGRLWFGTGGGEVLCYSSTSETQEKWTLYTKSDGLAAGVITSILPTFEEKIWVVHANSEHASVFDGKVWTTIPLPHFLPALDLGDYGGKLLQTHDGIIWLSARYMLFAYQSGQWRKYEASDISIPSTRNVFMETVDGALWFADPDDYIRRVDYKTSRWATLLDLNFQWENDQGAQWFLHRSGRVVVREGNQWTSFGVEDGLMDTPVALLGTRNGEVWVAGSHKGKAATAQLEGPKWRRYVHEEFACGIDWRAMFESTDGSIWIGAFVYTDATVDYHNGLLQFYNGEWIYHHQPEGFPHNNSVTYRSILLPPSRDPDHPIEKFLNIGESRDGKIWAGRNVLAYYDQGKWDEYDPTPDIRSGIVECMLTTENGDFWIGTRQYGAWRYDGREWRQFQGRNSLVANSVRSLAQTTDGSIWAATDRGFSRFDGRSWMANVLPEELNIRHEGGNLKAAPSGNLWINRFHVDWYRRFWERAKSVAPDADFRAVCYDSRGKPPETTITTGLKTVAQPGNIAILWSGVASWREPQDSRLQYSYRLDGGPWSPYSSISDHSFFSLPSGNHHFEVRARDHDFNVDPTPATLDFVVLPPVWRQGWFILLMIVAAGIIFTLAIRVLLERGHLRKLNLELDQRVRVRTAELEAANNDLEAFAYSVSHDLRTPLRHINGFMDMLQDEIASKLNENSKQYITTIVNATTRMGTLIDDLLSFSRMGRLELSKSDIDLHVLVREIIADLTTETTNRSIKWHIHKLPVVSADSTLIRVVLDNLISNAIKYSGTREVAEIEIGHQECKAESIIYIRDNGVGFDMKYADKLFDVFQRFHRVDEFEGTGIGLANVQKIIDKHHGRVWAEAAVNKGATFYFSLPKDTAV